MIALVGEDIGHPELLSLHVSIQREHNICVERKKVNLASVGHLASGKAFLCPNTSAPFLLT